MRDSPFSFLLDFSAPLDLCKVIQAAARNVYSCVVEMCWPCTYVKLFFGVSRIPGAYTVLDHLFWVRLGAPMPSFLQPFAFVGSLIVL